MKIAHDYRTNEIAHAAKLYRDTMSQIQDRRLLLDKEEIDAYRELMLALNADSPKELSSIFNRDYR